MVDLDQQTDKAANLLERRGEYVKSPDLLDAREGSFMSGA